MTSAAPRSTTRKRFFISLQNSVYVYLTVTPCNNLRYKKRRIKPPISLDLEALFWPHLLIVTWKMVYLCPIQYLPPVHQIFDNTQNINFLFFAIDDIKNQIGFINFFMYEISTILNTRICKLQRKISHIYIHSFRFAQAQNVMKMVSLSLFFLYNSSCRELGILQITGRWVGCPACRMTVYLYV